MKKILLVIDNLGSGGAQNQITLLAKGLKRKGHSVSVFTFYPQDFFKNRLEQEGIEIISTLKKDKLGWNVINSLRLLFNSEKYDVAISFLDTPNFYTILAGKLTNKRPKTIISYRSMSNFQTMSFVKRKVKEWVNDQADFIVSNSLHEKERWQKNYQFNAYKWVTIYNSISTDKFEMNFKNFFNNQNLLVVGSVGPAKNGLLIIEALRILKNKGITPRLTWVGQKIFHIPDRKNYLDLMEKRIEDYGLYDQWIWKEPTEAIDAEYSKAKGLILASGTEGLPNVVCEAMYSGLPCLVSNVLDHPNLIQHRKSGFLFDPSNVNELVNCIIELESLNFNQYNDLQICAKERAQKLFDFKKYISQFEDLIR